MTMRLLRHPVSQVVSVEDAFECLLSSADYALWQDSLGDRGVGKSFIAEGSPLAVSRDTWRTDLREAHRGLAASSCEGLPLGVFFVLPYEIASDTLGLPFMPEASQASPRAMRIDRGVEFDHHTGAVSLCALGEDWSGELALWRDTVLDRLAQATSGRALRSVPRGFACCRGATRPRAIST
jgi:para-aminobenzoate synthetase component I